MIVTEKIKINGNDFIKTFSDKGFYIERDGERYAEAIDPVDVGREYIETEQKIESEVETNGVE